MREGERERERCEHTFRQEERSANNKVTMMGCEKNVKFWVGQINEAALQNEIYQKNPAKESEPEVVATVSEASDVGTAQARTALMLSTWN